MRVLCLSRFWMYCNIADTAAVIQSDSCSTVVLHWVEKQKVVAPLASKRKEPERRKDERKPAGGGRGAHQLCKPLSRHRPVHKQRVCKHRHHHEGDLYLGEARYLPRAIKASFFSPAPLWLHGGHNEIKLKPKRLNALLLFAWACYVLEWIQYLKKDPLFLVTKSHILLFAWVSKPVIFETLISAPQRSSQATSSSLQGWTFMIVRRSRNNKDLVW